jgi:hypothetical protein
MLFWAWRPIAFCNMILILLRGHLNLISTAFLTLSSCLQYACGKTNLNDNFTEIYFTIWPLIYRCYKLLLTCRYHDCLYSCIWTIVIFYTSYTAIVYHSLVEWNIIQTKVINRLSVSLNDYFVIVMFYHDTLPHA